MESFFFFNEKKELKYLHSHLLHIKLQHDLPVSNTNHALISKSLTIVLQIVYKLNKNVKQAITYKVSE